MSIVFIVGIRPNFIKLAPLIHECKIRNMDYKIIHTGQHYDYNLSKIFFDELEIPEPDYYLNTKSGMHGYQTGKMTARIEKKLIELKPSMSIVIGDNNSTLAGALASVKLQIPCAHVEAGLRLFDKNQPEEINRYMVDSCSDLLFPPTHYAAKRLSEESFPSEKIFMNGNVLIDELRIIIRKIRDSMMMNKYNLEKKDYILITIHRPFNVDNITNLTNIINILQSFSDNFKLFFPIHKRTEKRLKQFGLWKKVSSLKNVIITEPLGYVEFITILKNSKMIITDSGGVIAESAYLEVPCIVIDTVSEWVEALENGSVILAGCEPNIINKICTNTLKKIEEGWTVSNPYPYWDKTASKSIINIINSHIKNKYKIPTYNFINGVYETRIYHINFTLTLLDLKKHIPKDTSLISVYDTEGKPILIFENMQIKKDFIIRLWGPRHSLDSFKI